MDMMTKQKSEWIATDTSEQKKFQTKSTHKKRYFHESKKCMLSLDSRGHICAIPERKIFDIQEQH
jgi:phage pi2 protein 07